MFKGGTHLNSLNGYSWDQTFDMDLKKKKSMEIADSSGKKKISWWAV
jgi:hypothetical protein